MRIRPVAALRLAGRRGGYLGDCGRDGSLGIRPASHKVVFDGMPHGAFPGATTVIDRASAASVRRLSYVTSAVNGPAVEAI